MTKRHKIVAASLLLMVTAAQAQDDVDHYAYLRTAANAIYEEQARTTALSPEVLAEITALGCNALRRLMKDDRFYADLEKLSSLLPDYRERNRSLAASLPEFMDSFLLHEIEVLMAAGLSNSAVLHITASISYLHEAIGNDTSPQIIVAALEGLEAEMCKAAADIEAYLEDVRTDAERRRTVTRWSMGIGGGVVIVADAATSAPSGGIAAGSYSLGGALIGAAAADALDDQD